MLQVKDASLVFATWSELGRRPTSAATDGATEDIHVRAGRAARTDPAPAADAPVRTPFRLPLDVAVGIPNAALRMLVPGDAGSGASSAHQVVRAAMPVRSRAMCPEPPVLPTAACARGTRLILAPKSLHRARRDGLWPQSLIVFRIAGATAQLVPSEAAPAGLLRWTVDDVSATAHRVSLVDDHRGDHDGRGPALEWMPCGFGVDGTIVGPPHWRPPLSHRTANDGTATRRPCPTAAGLGV